MNSFALGHIPDGYEQINYEEYGDVVMIIYGDTNGNVLIFNISLPDTYAADTESRDYREEIHHGIAYHIFEAHDTEDYSSVTWIEYGFMFNLTGAFTVDELMKIALSVE